MGLYVLADGTADDGIGDLILVDIGRGVQNEHAFGAEGAALRGNANDLGIAAVIGEGERQGAAGVGGNKERRTIGGEEIARAGLPYFDGEGAVFGGVGGEILFAVKIACQGRRGAEVCADQKQHGCRHCRPFCFFHGAYLLLPWFACVTD